MMIVEARNQNTNEHFETYHENDETVLCIQHDHACSVLFEISGSAEQQEVLVEQSRKAIERLDIFFEGRFAELFSGTRIKYGTLEDGTGGGTDENRDIFMDTEKMYLSLKEAERRLVDAGILEKGDWTSMFDEVERVQPGGTAFYNTIHEFAHLMDSQKGDVSWEGIPPEMSPTKYGRTKKNEAFAEAFTYLVLGVPLPDETKDRVMEKVANYKKRKLIVQEMATT